MDDLVDRRLVGRHGTDVQSVKDVHTAVEHLIWKQYGGWSVEDQQDLLQIVMIKYFQKFGRSRLPDDDEGKPSIPIGWLMTITKNAGIDIHRARKVRPADPADFQGPDAAGLERILAALNPQPSLSSEIAQRVDLERTRNPVLKAFHDAHPMDLKLLVWRLVEERDLKEISAIRGTSVDATRKAIQRAVNRLRKLTVELQ